MKIMLLLANVKIGSKQERLAIMVNQYSKYVQYVRLNNYYYYRQEFRYSWSSSATRTFKSTEMKMKTIGELAHAHSQLPPSHWL